MIHKKQLREFTRQSHQLLNIRLLFIHFILLSALLLCIVPDGPAWAQSADITTETIAPAATDNIARFRELLADPEVQHWLNTAPTEQTSQEDNASQFRDSIGNLISRIQARIELLKVAFADIRNAPDIVINSWKEQLSSTDTLRVITYIVIFLFVGAGFEWLYFQYTQYSLLNLQLMRPDNLRERVLISIRRAIITFGSLLAFSIGSIGSFVNFQWPEIIDDIVLNILIIVIVVRIATTVSRFFLSPKFEALRLVPFSSVRAKFLHRWVAVLVSIGVVNFAVADVFRQITSMDTDEVPQYAALSVDIFMNLIWLLFIFIAIWSIRRFFIGTSENPQRISNSSFWPFYLNALAVAVFILWVIDLPRLMWSMLTLGLLPPIVALFRNWVNNLFDQAEQVDALHGHFTVSGHTKVDPEFTDLPAEPLHEELATEEQTDDLHEHIVQRYEIYRPIVIRVVRFVLVVLAVLALMLVWGINLFTLSSSPSFGGKVVVVIVDIVIVLLIADLIWVWARSAIDRRLADYEPPPDGHAPGPEARMATLLPLLRTILFVTLLVMVVFSILAAIGVNIAPLLAGAGVLGVAIGFGAQALVRDVVSGIFFLIDDAFRVGEYIEIEGLRGTVETMSIRSLRIRHHLGAVHTIPFGELKALTNYSRDWVIMKMEFRVPFDTDLKLVKKLVKKIGAELQQHPDYGHAIIQPLKSQGVRRMEEFNMVVGVKFMAKPGEQWMIRRDAFQRVRDAFDANGIVFAERNVKVEVVNKSDLDKEIEDAAIGAAQEYVEQPATNTPIPDEP